MENLKIDVSQVSATNYLTYDIPMHNAVGNSDMWHIKYLIVLLAWVPFRYPLAQAMFFDSVSILKHVFNPCHLSLLRHIFQVCVICTLGTKKCRNCSKNQ